MKRALIACMGNVLRRDDGFGVVVAKHLASYQNWPDGVQVMEVGIGGIHLVQELMAGYDILVVVDAVERDGAPGTIHILEAEVPDLTRWPEVQRQDFLADMHYTTPTRALMLAKALGVLPPHVFIVGCQPVDAQSLGLELSEPVRQSVRLVAAELVAFIERVCPVVEEDS